MLHREREKAKNAAGRGVEGVAYEGQVISTGN